MYCDRCINSKILMISKTNLESIFSFLLSLYLIQLSGFNLGTQLILNDLDLLHQD